MASIYSSHVGEANKTATIARRFVEDIAVMLLEVSSIHSCPGRLIDKIRNRKKQLLKPKSMRPKLVATQLRLRLH